MEIPNTLLYPYVNYYFNLQQLVPQMAYFPSIVDYNSVFIRQQFSQRQITKINIPKAQNLQKNVQTRRISGEVQLRPKKRKYQVELQNQIKEKIQKFQDISIKAHKTKPIEQKQGRNANSNLLRMFFRRIQIKIEEEPHVLLSIMEKLQLKIKLQQFDQWLKENKVEYRNYIRLPRIKKLFEDSKTNREESKLLRILLKEFIDNQVINCYWTSKKVRKDRMSYNYRSIRSIFKQILQNNAAKIW